MFLVPVASRRPVRSFDAAFDDAIEQFFGLAAEPAQALRQPALDIVESDDGYTVTVDMPGVAKENVKVAIDGRRVDVTADVKRDVEKKDGERIVRRERSAASWARSFTLPAELDQSASSAKLEHGVLTLTLGKKRAPGAAQLTIN